MFIDGFVVEFFYLFDIKFFYVEWSYSRIVDYGMFYIFEGEVVGMGNIVYKVVCEGIFGIGGVENFC